MSKPLEKSEGNEQAWLRHMQAGKVYFQQGQMRDAVRQFTGAAQRLPHRVEGWVNLGSALLESGQLKASGEALNKAIRLNPRLMAAHMILGDVQRMLGNVPQATACYGRAVSLQRAPLALNKLACVLRSQNQFKEARSLYLEAMQIEPRFTLARVNYATLLIDLRQYEDAEEHLCTLETQPLPPMERDEAYSARLALGEFRRLREAIAVMCKDSNLDPLETALRALPESMLPFDEGALHSVHSYVESIRDMPLPPPVELIELPQEWPLVEAMFMVPLVNSLQEYQQIRTELEDGQQPEGELLESVNMEPAIQAARRCRGDMGDPVKAELHLRHWHALACQGVGDILPGHFKYTQNWTARSPTLKRVNPAMASSTLRHFISTTYNTFTPGMLRVALIFMGVLDLHPFADGNGRVVLTWINRELEWAGLMPMIFTRKTGISGELGDAIIDVRTNGGDMTPVLNAMAGAQQFAVDFCRELERA